MAGKKTNQISHLIENKKHTLFCKGQIYQLSEKGVAPKH